MKTYRSKIDWWLMLLVFGLLGYPIIEGLYTQNYIVVLIFIVINSIILLLFRSIRYVINDTQLKVWYTKIDINTIKKIYATKNPLSSPALSIDRIAIVYNKYDEVLISPKNRAEFIEELLKVNPNIEVEV